MTGNITTYITEYMSIKIYIPNRETNENSHQCSMNHTAQPTIIQEFIKHHQCTFLNLIQSVKITLCTFYLYINIKIQFTNIVLLLFHQSTLPDMSTCVCIFIDHCFRHNRVQQIIHGKHQVSQHTKAEC